MMARPRIRSHKPEHTLNPKIGGLSDRAYRVWVAMLCHSDDEGRGVCRPDELRALLYAYQSKVKSVDVAKAVAELQAAGLVLIYRIDGREFYAMHDWPDHQRVDHPTPSKIPPPSTDKEGIARPREDSRDVEKPLTDRIGSDLIRSDQDQDQDREPTSGLTLEDYLEKLSPEGQEVVRQSVSVIATTRKSGKVAQSVLDSLARKLSRYPQPVVLEACRIYLAKDYASQGKAESYLLGIVRGEAKRQDGKGREPSSPFVGQMGKSPAPVAPASTPPGVPYPNPATAGARAINQAWLEQQREQTR